MNVRLAEKLADEIVQIFPTEIKVGILTKKLNYIIQLTLSFHRKPIT